MNSAGLSQFSAFIATLDTHSPEMRALPVSARTAIKSKPAPVAMLADDALTEVVTPQRTCPEVTFTTRLSAATYLNELLPQGEFPNAMQDVGLWAWLALYFFDQLRPMKNGLVIAANMGVDESRFIPSDYLADANARRQRAYRHLLRHPLEIYRLVDCNADRAMCLLVQPIYQPGDFVEQMASRQIYMQYKEMLATLTTLVVDPTSQKIRANASTKARRLDVVLQQFDCTWDLGFIARDLLIPMLPAEFEQFRNPTAAASKKSRKRRSR